MKIYLVFRLKDIASRKKEFIVDSVYTDINDAHKRQVRLLGCKDNCELLNYLIFTRNINDSVTGNTITGPNKQKSYIINKTLRGSAKLKDIL